MKKPLAFLIEQLKQFIDGKPKVKKPNPINLKKNKLIGQLQQAQVEQTALHVIYGKNSFTGNLIKYDKTSQKIILKNFKQNLSVIISLDEIDKISLVPKTISYSQKQRG